MKKRFLLIAVLTAFTFAGIKADELQLPEGMEILTPEGVTVTTSTTRAYDKDKPITVAGSKENGYKVYFTATEAEHGEELWVSDGTAAGTFMVKDIYPGPTASNVSYITRFNDKVVFRATANEEDEAELWISDGTAAGTYMVKDINLIGASNPMGFIQINETHFIFAAIDFDSYTYGAEAQHWLWISDGTEEGTTLLKDCSVKYPGQSAANDEIHFMRVGRKVFFKADTKDNEFGEEVWVTDGTEAGTFMLLDINKSVIDEGSGATGGSKPDWFTNFKNEKLFFSAFSDEYGNEPWVSDGTTEGTYMIKDLTPGLEEGGQPRGHGVFTRAVYKDKVFFRGYAEEDNAVELMCTDFTPEGTYMVANINTNPTATGTEASTPDIFCEFDGVLFMKAQSGTIAEYENNKGLELFYTDGTAAGTVMQSDLNPGTGPNAAWEGIVISGSFYFRAQNKPPGGPQLWELFRINHKDEFPVHVMDLGDGPDFVHTLRNMNGDLYFTSQLVPRFFKYHYRKPNFDAEKDVESMEIDFGSEPSSTKEVKSKGTISFYPNPARDEVNIVSEDEVTGYSITDMTGRILVSKKTNATIVPVNLSKGMYVLSVSSTSDNMDSILVIE